MNTIRIMRAVLALLCALAVTSARAGAPYGRYTISTDTLTAYDNKTQLTWQRGQAPPYAPGAPSYTEAEAVTYCQGLNSSAFGGFTGWRLPTKKELETLVDPTVAITSMQLAIDETAFPTTDGNNYLTSTNDASFTAYWWVVTFADGSSSAISPNGGSVCNVRCVN